MSLRPNRFMSGPAARLPTSAAAGITAPTHDSWWRERIFLYHRTIHLMRYCLQICWQYFKGFGALSDPSVQGQEEKQNDFPQFLSRTVKQTDITKPHLPAEMELFFKVLYMWFFDFSIHDFVCCTLVPSLLLLRREGLIA